MITRRTMLVTAALAALPLPVLAQRGAPAEDPAVARVRGFYNTIQNMVRDARNADRDKMLNTLSEAVARAFDLPAMTRAAVGPQWSKIPAPKQKSLQEAFGRYFVATYVSRLGSAVGGRFEVAPEVETRPNGRLVRTRIIDAQNNANAVDYLTNADNKIIDVYLDGTVSEIAQRRTEFGAALKKGGADALEAELRERAEKLFAEARR